MKKEMEILAMNLVAMMLVEDIAEECGKSTEDVLLDFMQSKTAKNLYNNSLKLWWDGPSAVGEQYKQELEQDSLQSPNVTNINDDLTTSLWRRNVPSQQRKWDDLFNQWGDESSSPIEEEKEEKKELIPSI